MSSPPGGASRLERPNVTGCRAVDPVTMEMMQRYGIGMEHCTVEKDSQSQTHNNLSHFLGKYHFEAPNMQIKPFVDKQRKSNQEHVFKTPPSIPIDLANTASLSSSRSEDTNNYLWKVKHNGEFLGSTSFGSSSNEVNSNPTHMLKLLKLKTATEESNSSTSTEKITNHGSRYDESPNRSYSYIRSFANAPSFQTKLRNRLSQVATETPVYQSLSQPKSLSETDREKKLTLLSRSADSRSQENAMLGPSDPAHVSQTQTQVLLRNDSDGVREATSNADLGGDDSNLIGFASLRVSTALSTVGDATPIASPNKEVSHLGEAGDLTEAKESGKQSMTKPTTNEADSSLSKTLSGSYDESEFKQMANITNTYQKFDSGTKNVKPGSKVSAIPMSGIGVDLRNNYVCDSQRVLTPREASNTSCSIASLVDTFFGKGSSKKESPFAFVTMICSPLPEDISSPSVKSFGTLEPEKQGYDDASFQSHNLCDSDDDSETGTHSTIDSFEKENSYTGSDESNSSFSESKLSLPLKNSRSVQRSELDQNSAEMSEEDDKCSDISKMTMSTLTYSKVNSLYGSNAITGYHRGSMGGYYNRNIDAQDYDEDDEWETSSRLTQSTITQSTFGVVAKPFRPQNYLPSKPYNRTFGVYYDRQFHERQNALRECSHSRSGTYDADDDRETTFTSSSETDRGSSIRGYL
ncbi:hypothetical protein HJC23_002538 [Cyclotella cryptica]|uniref:Uncharacterized protein n=1 Tax=Cyclotella cryptica TaxID=29204 RepID=A0ABD3QWA5_9STRA|eukprot:CCRYP_001381-RA/>CCRYP_001381-RA protein AED:0.01 eAED:0.01 QI:1435/1/1/1/0.5/0.33/3/255/691